MSLPHRLERVVGEPVRDAVSQSVAFLNLCLSEGLDDDQIIILSRRHGPTQDAYPYDAEAVVERRLAKLRAEQVASSDPVYLDWSKAEDTPNDPTWCVDGWIEQGDSVSLVGPAKIGKSLLALEAAACKATGASFLGRDVSPGPVLYLDWENRPEMVFRRLRAMDFDFSGLKALSYVSLPSMAPLDTQAGSGAALKLVRDTGAELLVIDTLQRVVTGEENSSQSIRDLYRHLLLPLRADGVAVLRLDHLGKGEQSTARGSSAKVDDVDQAWLLKARKDGLYSLRRTHGRSGTGKALYALNRASSPHLKHEVVGDAGDDEDEDEDSFAGMGLKATVARLDALHVPQQAGRTVAVRALKEAGHSYSTQTVSDAVKIRKARI